MNSISVTLLIALLVLLAFYGYVTTSMLFFAD